jgi:multisubunit Na+/H+ antiporter MnhF subunit
MVALLSRMWESALFLDLVLIVSSLGFFGTVALVLFLQRSLAATRSRGETTEVPLND